MLFTRVFPPFRLFAALRDFVAARVGDFLDAEGDILRLPPLVVGLDERGDLAVAAVFLVESDLRAGLFEGDLERACRDLVFLDGELLLDREGLEERLLVDFLEDMSADIVFTVYLLSLKKMSSPFVDSLGSQDSEKTSHLAKNEMKDLSDIEVQLIRDAVAGEGERRAKAVILAQKSVKNTVANPVPKTPPALRARNEPLRTSPPDASCENEDSKVTSSSESDHDDLYHKPNNGKKFKPPKNTPWVWIVIIIIITAAILYSWYDYTKETNARKDVRAFVAAMLIVVAAVILYLLIRQE